jgi:hypothetical protein
MRSGHLLSAVFVAVTLSSTLGFAQTTPAAKPGEPSRPAAGAPANPPSESAIAEARKHYEAGIAMYDAGDYEPALAELDRAYQLAPSHKIRYNLGQIHRMLKNYVLALKDFQAYVAGGTNEPKAKVAEAEKYISELSLVVAKVNLTSNIADADVAVDGDVVGKTPLTEPILLNPGNRTVQVSKSGFVPASKTLRVAPQDSINLQLDPTVPTVNVVRKEAGRAAMPWYVPVGLAATGVFAVVGAVTGGLALGKESKLEDAKKGNQPTNLQSLHDDMRTFATVSDVAFVATAVVGVVSAYFTVKWLTTPYKETTNVGIRPTLNGFSGTF